MFRIASTVCRRITSFKVPCRSFCQAEYELPKNLSKRQVASLKKMERKIGKEQERVRTVKKRNVYTGLALGGLVFSIYVYTMLAVKQETVLKEMDIEFEDQLLQEAGAASTLKQ